MGYTTLSLEKNNNTRKYILFYADYLNEAWLSEVMEDDQTKIIKQFKCKNHDDLASLVSFISKRGKVVNLTSSDTAEQVLKLVENRLVGEFKSPSIIDKAILTLVPYRMLWNRLTSTAESYKMAS
jgi:hypothetical protein